MMTNHSAQELAESILACLPDFPEDMPRRRFVDMVLVIRSKCQDVLREDAAEKIRVDDGQLPRDDAAWDMPDPRKRDYD